MFKVATKWNFFLMKPHCGSSYGDGRDFAPQGPYPATCSNPRLFKPEGSNKFFATPPKTNSLKNARHP
jgi:hypothetical protein